MGVGWLGWVVVGGVGYGWVALEGVGGKGLVGGINSLLHYAAASRMMGHWSKERTQCLISSGMVTTKPRSLPASR